MEIRKKIKIFYLWTAVLLSLVMVVPGRVTGEVKPITEAEEKLEGITEEEQKTLEKLFTLTQELEELEREEARLTEEIDELKSRIAELDKSIDKEQKSYDNNLYIMKQVLLSYQRGGPASYLEILLQSESLTSFLKNMNLIKDISRNTAGLLDTIEAGKEKLKTERESLAADNELLLEKQEELEAQLEEKLSLKKEQEVYLKELKDEKAKYEEHLNNLRIMWEDLKGIFSSIVGEFSRIIGEGYFTIEDLNLSFNLFSIKGSVSEDTFNTVLKEHSNLPEIVFHFDEDNVTIEVPDKKLALYGRFTISGNSALLFEPESGTFYGMPLETESINELFKEGPFLIDFEAVAGDLVLIDINLDSIETKDGYLIFTIKTGLPF
jgi:peptidoglycan hydrolase CwlO-like protein